ncbi:protein FAM83H [Fundulus heteroclitus]|uniref:protein FAM83H n=1 Tax=Fundulus heteroclitus TaxID=8078 RepID=UPI00165B3118|nr:protein FAM83H [Fundulus heteroclitus]
MPHRSQSSSVGDNPLDPNYLPPHYREDYRLAIDALIENDIQGYYEFLQTADLVGFLSETEIQYIRSTLQGPSQPSGAPELTYYEGGQDAEGSSDTYWPMQSDLAAPGLDLGWPTPQLSFIGPTEVTTLVNPCDPEMPSIKEQARRLIKNARQVIAIVMDIFTDVDIFADLLDAAGRHVPVYILLDEKDVHHFVSMVMSCKVNLDLIHMMRVRTVAGVTYYSRTGKSFKGQVKDRFLLTDCSAVLSGNYSFMWSYEKIHRCIAHLFLGELVTTFDEEFRILFAQSEPLVIDLSSGPLTIPDPGTSSYMNTQFGLQRSQSLRSYRRQPEIPSAFPYGELDRNSSLPFRRTESFRHTLDPSAGITIGKYSQQQFRLQQSFLEQGKSIVSRQMEMSSSAYKRHSYAEGTQENYSSSRQYMKHRVMNNLDETDFRREQMSSSHFYSEGPGPGSGHGHYDRLRGRPSHLAIDQYSESSFHSDREPVPGSRDYFSSEDLRGPEGLHPPPVAGRYGGGSGSRRPTIGQAYACQSSPTHLHPQEKGQSQKQSDQEYNQDPTVKQGMRSWRIHSYLSAYEDGGEEGLPQPMGHDTFDEPLPAEPPGTSEGLAPVFGIKDPPTVPPKPRPDILRRRFGKPIVPESTNKDSAPTARDDVHPSFTEFRSSILERRDREVEKEKDRESERDSSKERVEESDAKETPDLFLSRHESFRSRVNPLLQRSSRLRSSLIFSSSKAEIHSSTLGLTPATEEDDQLDSGRTTSLVAQILEKRRSWSREPLDWRKKAEEKDKKEKEEREREEKVKEKENEMREKQQKMEIEKKYLIKEKEEPHATDNTGEKTTLSSQTTEVKPSVNINDPASRLQYFKDLENKRKASKMETELSQKALEPAEKKPGLSEKPPLNTTGPPKSPNVNISSTEQDPKKPLNTTAPPKVPTVNVSSTEQEPKKPDISAKLAEHNRRHSVSSAKPSIITPKPFVSSLKSSEALHPNKKENETDGQMKDESKGLKPFPSPKIFRKDHLKIKSLNPRRTSCSEDILTKDATDAEKSEMKKSRSHSSSTLPREESREGLHKIMGSTTSLNTVSEGKGDGKTLEFLKKQTQRLKGLLGPKDKEKKASGDDKGMSTVMEVADDTSKKQGSSAKVTTSTATEQPSTNHKESAGKSAPSRYQAPGSSALYSSNLRDDTKVILEQISANSQKNRQEREETGGNKDSSATDKGTETQSPFKRNRFLRPQGNTQEREGLLKRIESLRKEKKVYSRFEMGNSLA